MRPGSRGLSSDSQIGEATSRHCRGRDRTGARQDRAEPVRSPAAATTGVLLGWALGLRPPVLGCHRVRSEPGPVSERRSDDGDARLHSEMVRNDMVEFLAAGSSMLFLTFLRLGRLGWMVRLRCGHRLKTDQTARSGSESGSQAVSVPHQPHPPPPYHRIPGICPAHQATTPAAGQARPAHDAPARHAGQTRRRRHDKERPSQPPISLRPKKPTPKPAADQPTDQPPRCAFENVTSKATRTRPTGRLSVGRTASPAPPGAGSQRALPLSSHGGVTERPTTLSWMSIRRKVRSIAVGCR